MLGLLCWRLGFGKQELKDNSLTGEVLLVQTHGLLCPRPVSIAQNFSLVETGGVVSVDGCPFVECGVSFHPAAKNGIVVDYLTQHRNGVVVTALFCKNARYDSNPTPQLLRPLCSVRSHEDNQGKQEQGALSLSAVEDF